ncbi:hypothetical protein L1987_78270 [Smallanthus sonchifolius]|uniref:Uncharacterized protein n=1 Tax=Smallanthus sonchifolius TaxID=185202 RepID=A0ACB8ZGN6_9ASTR|nr:hypothetical protein L1987_78270 [Smallanthus sonchifolius]
MLYNMLCIMLSKHEIRYTNDSVGSRREPGNVGRTGTLVASHGTTHFVSMQCLFPECLPRPNVMLYVAIELAIGVIVAA